MKKLLDCIVLASALVFFSGVIYTNTSTIEISKKDKEQKTCTTCKGSGNSTSTCTFCNGTGKMKGGGTQCTHCRGKGWRPCNNCNGTGRK